MPELRVGERHWSVAAGSNLLDALNQNGVPVPYSCRAGSCHACLVQCVRGLPSDSRPDALSAQQREQGWRLACQCQVVEDLQVHAFDPQTDGRSGRSRGGRLVEHHGAALARNPPATVALQRRAAPGVVGGQRGAAVFPRQPAARRPFSGVSSRLPHSPGNSAMPPGNCASAIRSVSANCAAVPCITTLTGTPGRCG